MPNRRKSFIFFYCCLISSSLLAQTGTNNLLSKLNSAANDSQKIAAYKNLIDYYSVRNPDSANLYANEGIAYSHKHNYPLGEGLILAHQGMFDENQGRVELGSERTYKALNIFRELHYLKGVGEMLHNLGAIEGSKGNYDVAVKYLIDALKVYDSVADNHGLMLTYMNLGNLYLQHRDTINTWKYLRLADKISKTIPINEATIFLHNTIGVMYAEKGDTLNAEKIFLDNLKESDDPRFVNARAESELYVGKFYSEKGDVKSALRYLQDGLNTSRANHLPEMEANILLEMAKLLEGTDPSSAINYLNKARVLCETIQSKAYLATVYDELAKVYKRQGNYKDALVATEQKQILNDSLFNVSKSKEIANLSSSYDLAKSNVKVNELQHAGAVIAKERDIIVIIATVIIMMLAILFFFYRKTATLNKRLLIHERDLKELNSMKDKLFSVIGHDLRGPIARIPTIVELYESNDTDKEEKKFLLDSLKEQTKLSLETFDKLLYWGQSLVKGVRLQQVKMKPKPYICESIALRKMKIAEKNITVTDTTPEDLYVFADPTFFDFIIRNLIGNALKYTNKGGTIQINADTQSKTGYTVFTIKDNGIGIDAAGQSRIFSALKSTAGTDNEKGHGIGLMLCKEFAVLNGGDIWVESELGKGSAFYFSVKNIT